MTTATPKDFLDMPYATLRKLGVNSRVLELRRGTMTPTADKVTAISEATGIPEVPLFLRLRAVAIERMEEELAVLKTRARR